MLQAFIITLREGLEAFLIVAISLAYLRKSGRNSWCPQCTGASASVVLSIGAAVLFQRASNQALWEGVLALTAAVLVASLIVHMWRHAKPSSATSSITSRCRPRRWASGRAGVFLFTLLMITREGMETALLMGTLILQGSAPSTISARGLGHGRGGVARGCGRATGTT